MLRLPSALAQMVGPPPLRERISSSQIEGVTKGALTEIVSPLGGGKTSLVLQILAENPHLQVAWVEREVTIYPPAFVQRGIHLQNLLFVEGGRDSLWALLQILRTHLFDLVVATCNRWQMVELRRLQLAAEKADAAVLLLTEAPIQEGRWTLAGHVNVAQGSAV